MSEKMYTRLFRLYPSRFRKEYEGEALQLLRDRLRDETGFFKRARLLWDLVADVLVGLPQAYRNSYAATEAASLSPNAEGIPSFKVLDEEPLVRGSILLGGALSLATIVAFGFLLSRSIAHLPVPGSNGRMSPIEAVMERLNRATTPDTPMGGPEEASGSTSVGASERQPRPWPAAAASTSKLHAPALLPGSRNVVGGQNHIVSIPTQNPNERSVYLTTQLPAGEASAWRGALTDAFGRPVRSAEIHLIGGHGELVARTAADGSFAFSELPSGDYEVAVVLGGREVAYLNSLHLSAISSPSRLTLASGGHLLVFRPGELP
jgi:Carboxypeptidase regulatory-like domain